MKTPFVLLLLFSLINGALAQSYVIRDIKSFGASGNGRTNDQEAFEKAADFFNARGGRGKLVISKGTYIIGKQDFTAGKDGKAAYRGHDVLSFTKVKDLIVEGMPGALLRYQDSLRFGAFDPETGLPYPNKKYFTKWSWAALIGHCILIDGASNVEIRNLELDGNNKALIKGGVWGDKGIQLPHYGIFIRNSRNVTVANITAHHFALDGISVANNAGSVLDNIRLEKSSFEYNGRQGFSWIGGNGLVANECSFSHTGRGSIASPPGAGVDIEAEVGPIRNGRFSNCVFINNTGVGMVADNGDSREVRFDNCTFWGTTAWSAWVKRPAFSFNSCNFYGSFVHGYRAENDQDATSFDNCYFEDKKYQGKEPYGNYLVESNTRKRVRFTKCTFVSNTKKSVYISAVPSWAPEEKYQFKDCYFIFRNNNLPRKDFVALVRGMRYSNCTFQYTSEVAKERKYYLNSCCDKNYNVDEGGNTTIYKPESSMPKPNKVSISLEAYMR